MRVDFPQHEGAFQSDGSWRSESYLFSVERWKHRASQPAKKRMTFAMFNGGVIVRGKHSGELIQCIPTNYLEWLAEQKLPNGDRMVVEQELLGRADSQFYLGDKN